jgi:hypothetical protein
MPRAAFNLFFTAYAPSGKRGLLFIDQRALPKRGRRRQGSGRQLMILALYRTGALKLRELITNTYRLDEINRGYADLEAGRNLRGVVVPGV